MKYQVSLHNSRSVFLIGLLVLVVAGTAVAQLGTTNSKFAPQQRTLVNGPEKVIHPETTAIYPFADYATGGVALRNQVQRSIILSGAPNTTPLDAYVYWSVLGPVNAADSSVTIQRLWPNPSTPPYIVTLTGDQIAVGPDPCWGSDGNHVYRAHPPVSVVTGNGNYLVKFATAASGLADGEDPWNGHTVFPLMEGAALVTITTGTHFVTVYDSQAGMLLIPPSLSYTLSPFIAAFPGGPIRFDTIGADGQVGMSTTAEPGVSMEQTFITNIPIQIAGTGSPTNTDSDWNGNSGAPLPQLFDVTGHSFTPSAPVSQLNVLYTSGGDCTNIIANVASE